jgi:4-amino-4-deoxy-L-arabinose transferase-like glycosyltransferase
VTALRSSPGAAAASVEPSAPDASKRPLLIVCAASLALSLVLALAFPLVDPDEGRNAEVAAEMARDGDVVIPHLAGVPYLDKPPALFAMSALAVRIIGPRPLAARLPAMLASFATLALLAGAWRRLAGEARAWLPAALLAASPLAAVLAAYAIFDMPLTACVTAVWTLLALELELGPTPGRRAAMALAVALGILLKGPVMLAWALGGAAAAALLVRDRSPLRWLGWPPGWLLALGPPLVWFAAALRRHPEYAHYAFLEESWERMTSGSFHRQQPLWFVPAVLVGGALPWSLLTPWRAPASRSARVAAGFVLFAAAFFTLSRSKLVTYLLPALPALAWWAAERWPLASRPRWRWLVTCAFTPLLLAGAWPALQGLARTSSGAPLAYAISAAGATSVRYEDCYSPGTDYLLGRRSIVVSGTGDPLTSNYAVRYRDALRRRGEWTLVDSSALAPPADVIVRARSRAGAAPAGFREIFRDTRFIAWRRPPG